MPEPLHYFDPKLGSRSSPLWLSQLKVVVKENIITTCCAAAIILANAVVGIVALIDPVSGVLILLPLDFTLVGVSILLTPFVWRNSDETCQHDSTRIILVAIHLLVSILLPFLCFCAAVSLDR
jgi:hypothetical protein